MKRILVDTAAWIALQNAKDPDHEAVKRWLAACQDRLVITSDIVDETLTLSKARWGHHVAETLGKHMLDPDNVQLVHIDETFFALAWERFQARKDKGYSFTDCSSFVVMERMGIETAATLDQHFQQEGFEVVPSL